MKLPTSQFCKLILSAVMAVAIDMTVMPQANAQQSVSGSLYMHNVKANGEAIDFGSLLDQSTAKYKSNREDVAAPNGQKLGTVLTVSNGDTAILPARVLKNSFINENNGRTIRFFIWISGEKVEAKNNLWIGAPSVKLLLNDNYSNVIAKAESQFKTRGTYPWHCYYIDFVIPKNTELSEEAAHSAAPVVEQSASEGESDDIGFGDLLDELVGSNEQQRSVSANGLHIELSCLSSGKAHFAGLSYELLPVGYSEKRESWLDGATGTYAPNPQYDELPMLLMYGLDSAHKWQFLNGNNAFASLKTISGLREYIAKNNHDWFQMEYGIAHLPYLYIAGTNLKLAEGFEEGWLEALGKELDALQDATTGLWLCNGSPNIMVSAAIVNGCYTPFERKRTDVKREATLWNATSKDVKLHNADKIIDTLLGCRLEGGAWNRFCLQNAEFDSTVNINAADLAATTAAMQLLGRAMEEFTVADKAYIDAQSAMREAWAFCLDNFMMKSQLGIWRDSVESTVASKNGAYFLELIEATRVLEQRTRTSMALPSSVAAKKIPGDIEEVEIKWDGDGGNDIVSLRVYCATADTTMELLSDKHLIGVIEKNPKNMLEKDPYIAVRTIVEAARKNWGVTPEKVGAKYTDEKMKSIPRKLTLGAAGKRVIIKAPSEMVYDNEADNNSGIKFYIAAVNSYGDHSPFTEIMVPEVSSDETAQQ